MLVDAVPLIETVSIDLGGVVIVSTVDVEVFEVINIVVVEEMVLYVVDVVSIAANGELNKRMGKRMQIDSHHFSVIELIDFIIYP